MGVVDRLPGSVGVRSSLFPYRHFDRQRLEREEKRQVEAIGNEEMGRDKWQWHIFARHLLCAVPTLFFSYRLFHSCSFLIHPAMASLFSQRLNRVAARKGARNAIILFPLLLGRPENGPLSATAPADTNKEKIKIFFYSKEMPTKQ